MVLLRLVAQDIQVPLDFHGKSRNLQPLKPRPQKRDARHIPLQGMLCDNLPHHLVRRQNLQHVQLFHHRRGQRGPAMPFLLSGIPRHLRVGFLKRKHALNPELPYMLSQVPALVEEIRLRLRLNRLWKRLMEGPGDNRSLRVKIVGSAIHRWIIVHSGHNFAFRPFWKLAGIVSDALHIYDKFQNTGQLDRPAISSS
jgi:hypothetical protein